MHRLGNQQLKILLEQISLLPILIASYQPQMKNEEFQVWTLKKNSDESAIVSCTDGNDKVLKTQRIPWTDFKADEATLWVEGNVCLLPSEH